MGDGWLINWKEKQRAVILKDFITGIDRKFLDVNDYDFDDNANSFMVNTSKALDFSTNILQIVDLKK